MAAADDIRTMGYVPGGDLVLVSSLGRGAIFCLALCLVRDCASACVFFLVLVAYKDYISLHLKVFRFESGVSPLVVLGCFLL